MTSDLGVDAGGGDAVEVPVNARWVDPAPRETPDGPSYAVTRYTAYPTGYTDVADPRRYWCLTVEDAGDGWAVRWRSRCLNYRGEWEFEPPVRSRTSDFLCRCRFAERAALLRAQQSVDDLVVDAMTYTEFVVHIREQAATEARRALKAGRSRSLLDDPSAVGATDPVLPLHVRLRRAVSTRTRTTGPRPPDAS